MNFKSNARPRLWIVSMFAVLGLSPAPAQDYFPPPDSEGGWRTLTGAAAVRKVAGMDLQKLDWAFDYASRSSQHGGLLVARHLSLIHISEPTRLLSISYAVFCLK